MSIFSSVLVVYTMATCNNYFADTSEIQSDAVKNSIRIDSELDEAMHTESGMIEFLNKYHIGETVFEIVSIEVEVLEVQENEIP